MILNFGKVKVEVVKEVAVSPLDKLFGFCINPVSENSKEKTRICLSPSLLDAMNLRVTEEESKTFTYVNLAEGLRNTMFCKYLPEAPADKAISIKKNGCGSNKVLITELRNVIEKEFGISNDVPIYVSLKPLSNIEGFDMYSIEKINDYTVNTSLGSIVEEDEDELQEQCDAISLSNVVTEDSSEE